MTPTRSRIVASLAMMAFALALVGVLAFHPRTDAIDAYAEAPVTQTVRDVETSSSSTSTSSTSIVPFPAYSFPPPTTPPTTKPFIPFPELPKSTTTTTKPATPSTTAAPKAAPVVATYPSTTRPPAPPTTTAPTSSSDAAFLACVKQRESGGNYQAVGNGYYGAYQFAQSTWNGTAQHAGRGDLVGVRPDHASPADQDAMAWALLAWQGRAPWGGHCP